MSKTSELQSLGIAVLRVVVGAAFLIHGGQKLFVFGFHGVGAFFAQLGIPAFLAPVVTLVEFLGGAALILGLFTRWAALLIAADMVGAILFVHGKNGFFLPNGFEYALTMLAANLGLALAGAGAFALDNILGKGSEKLSSTAPGSRSAAA